MVLMNMMWKLFIYLFFMRKGSGVKFMEQVVELRQQLVVCLNVESQDDYFLHFNQSCVYSEYIISLNRLSMMLSLNWRLLILVNCVKMIPTQCSCWSVAQFGGFRSHQFT